MYWLLHQQQLQVLLHPLLLSDQLHLSVLSAPEYQWHQLPQLHQLVLWHLYHQLVLSDQSHL
jgi:hypothetical protein